MIVTLSGVTGCGKSYYKKFLVDNMDFENMVIYTTRKPRMSEKDGVDKHFITKEELIKKEKSKEIFTYYKFLNEYYGYGSFYLPKDIKSVTELHYEWIKSFKEKAKNVFSIYIFPTDLNLAKKALKERKLSKEVEIKRLQEIDDHFNKVKKNKELLKQFDYIIYNDYTEKTDIKMLNKVEEVLTKEKHKLVKVNY